jgi:hypothetical protein
MGENGKMYLHLGQDTVVRVADIIGVFDVKPRPSAKSPAIFLRMRSVSFA